MKKLVFVFVALALFAGTVFAATGRQRAVAKPERVELVAPFQIGISYGNGDDWILTGLGNNLFLQQVLKYALGNSLPERHLDLSRGFAEIVVTYANGKVAPMRWYAKTDVVYRGAIVPFDPLNPYATDMFVKGTQVDNLVVDCPIWGIPNNDKIQSITAVNHFPHYVMIDPPVFHAMNTASVQAVLGIPLDTQDGYRLMLFDHYSDAAGEWFVKAEQCLRDVNGKLITYDYERAGCNLIM